MVNIPSDLRKNKETIIGNMNLRECICLFLGLLLAIGILYYIRVILGYKRIVIAAFIGGIFMIPFLFVGFKKINGMKIDDYFKVFVNNKILANEIRINACQYIERKVSSSKYEILRYYKLSNKTELLALRKDLLDRKILILTEYIDYKNEKIVIFRLDGKDMILDQIRRNKEIIENKNKEIKDLIKNEMKPAYTNKEKLTELKERLNELKSEKRYYQIKSFEELKNEVDIFENVSNIKAERINVKTKKKKEIDEYDYATNLRKIISEDKREMYQLHLFNKLNLRDIIRSLDDKIVFINAENEVDVYYYSEIEKFLSDNIIIDYNKVDKKNGLYSSTILSLEARNYYNHYRNINDLEEIL